MNRPGRNDPCPCQSGKKYKKCCLPVHDAADAERIRVLRLPPAESYEQVEAEMAELNDLSRRTADAIAARDYTEAERLCEELRARYVDQIDHIERRAELLEARGDLPEALQWHRKALLFAQTHAGFDEEGHEVRREKIAALAQRVQADL